MTEEPGGPQPMRSQRIGHNLATKEQNSKDSLLSWVPSAHLHLPRGRTSQGWKENKIAGGECTREGAPLPRVSFKGGVMSGPRRV